jgi:hypothetical protein
VHFENLATASAPAHLVTVTDQLDPQKFDLTTFRLGPITLGAVTLVRAPGSGRSDLHRRRRPPPRSKLAGDRHRRRGRRGREMPIERRRGSTRSTRRSPRATSCP